MSSLTSGFIRQNEWANLTLIEACRGLSEEQLDATGDGLFGSIRETWQHVISSELYYARLLGQTIETWDKEKVPWPGWDGLAEMAGRAAEGLIAAAADAEERRVRSSSGKWDIDAAVVVIQAVHHGTDHRSQINTLLTTLGVEPADVSSWGWGEADGRMHAV